MSQFQLEMLQASHKSKPFLRDKQFLHIHYRRHIKNKSSSDVKHSDYRKLLIYIHTDLCTLLASEAHLNFFIGIICCHVAIIDCEEFFSNFKLNKCAVD